MPREVGVVLVAAGRGERLGTPVAKQFLDLGGQPMLLRALRAFTSHPDVAEVALVLPPSVMTAMPEWLAGLAGDLVRLVAGGELRMDSVEHGIHRLGPACQVILVHDAARPFVSREVIDGVIAAARAGEGAIAAIPVSDTLKAAGPEGELIGKTLSREGVWRAQTPQGFPRTMLERAYADARTARITGTDESELVERIGGRVRLVRDSAWNLKVTTPDDLRLAELIARQV